MKLLVLFSVLVAALVVVPCFAGGVVVKPAFDDCLTSNCGDKAPRPMPPPHPFEPGGGVASSNTDGGGVNTGLVCVGFFDESVRVCGERRVLYLRIPGGWRVFGRVKFFGSGVVVSDSRGGLFSVEGLRGVWVSGVFDVGRRVNVSVGGEECFSASHLLREGRVVALSCDEGIVRGVFKNGLSSFTVLGVV